MNKTTTVRAEFIVSKEAIFPLSEFTDRLEIEPIRSYNLGDRVRDLDLYRKVSCWCVGTQDEESYDINNQLSQLIDILVAKQQVLIDFQ
ncbi:DUF4279 domain-containing protein [Peribacillus frigoritolerans]|uniref:DUF4279 domain-containing protein n=1 Tax=Peribacillus frigoritolerans TaxID=450367 RepID=UPI001059E38B|nr:DUF4279 domain-containing protein [Peribacillus frigoritolerans]TDL76134.1 DUF4279 domain-containing protein [Peribacillus frigoritolerans]